MAVLAAGALLWGFAAGPAAADNIRDGQWALTNYAAARQVWPVSQGEGVVVAVIDGGVAEHQDLTGQVLPGADFSGGHGQGRDDTVGHGTGMASLIAGHGHGDQAGIMGLAPKAKILPIKVALTDSGDLDYGGPQTDLGDAIRYAADHGAKVINMSIAGVADAPSRDAVKYAVSKDVVVVAGAGNLGHQVQYPAAYPGVVAVGAIDKQGAIWPKSNFGPEVTLVAPGVDVYRAMAKSASSYGQGTGTSDSTAYVSAIAALVRSKYPQLSAGQVINRLIKSAVAPPDGSKVPNDHYGYGIASPSKALAANPAVDNGPKENPLLTRVESHGDPAVGASRGGSVAVYAIVGVVALLVIVGIVLLVRRRGRRNDGDGGGSGGSGGAGGYAPPAYAPGAQPYQQQPYQQQQQPYAPPQQPYPPQYQQQPYPPQSPPPPQENPYR